MSENNIYLMKLLKGLSEIIHEQYLTVPDTLQYA